MQRAPTSAPEVPFDEIEFKRMAEIARYAAPAYFADGASYDEIAEAIAAEEGCAPLSRQAIAKIERDALRKLRRILEARGINRPSDLLPEDPV